MIKFGQSTRDWLLCGPAELMPEEGPSKTQRLEARLLKVPAARYSKPLPRLNISCNKHWTHLYWHSQSLT
jgi:hypothetical protein